MTDKKKIGLKILTFIIAMIALELLYDLFIYKSDLNKYSPIIFNLRNIEDSCTILYLGESSNFNWNPKDSSRERISEFAAEYYPTIAFRTLDNAAYHAGNYKILLKNIKKQSPIQTVIVTLNLRSFDAAWRYSDLETALQKSMVLIDPRFTPLINRFRLSFKDFEIKTDDERLKQVQDAWDNETFEYIQPFAYKNVTGWDKAKGYASWLNEDGSWDLPKINLSCHYIKTYAFQIDTLTSIRIKDFDEIVRYAHKRGWNLIFNLMAENTEKAEELDGIELVKLIRYNRDLLVNRYQRMGVMVVDNLEDVPDSLYTDRKWTTEHYAERGRKIVAKNLADSLRKIYPEYYRIPIARPQAEKTGLSVPAAE